MKTKFSTLPTLPLPLSLPGDVHLPLYHRLACYIQDSIARRHWKPGERLPPESEFASQLDLAVGTVRQAVANLVNSGLLVRLHGKGTFVNKPTFDDSLFRFWRFSELDGQPPESRILRLLKMPATEKVRDRLKLKKNENVIFISRLRLNYGKVIVAENIWLSQNKFASLLDLQKHEFGPLLYPLYEQVCGQYIARAEEWLSVHLATQKQAKLLALTPNAPVVAIERLARGYDNDPLEWRSSYGCTSMFQYHIEIR